VAIDLPSIVHAAFEQLTAQLGLPRHSAEMLPTRSTPHLPSLKPWAPAPRHEYQYRCLKT
jgi:hypothetical protein